MTVPVLSCSKAPKRFAPDAAGEHITLPVHVAVFRSGRENREWREREGRTGEIGRGKLLAPQYRRWVDKSPIRERNFANFPRSDTVPLPYQVPTHPRAILHRGGSFLQPTNSAPMTPRLTTTTKPGRRYSYGLELPFYECNCDADTNKCATALCLRCFSFTL